MLEEAVEEAPLLQQPGTVLVTVGLVSALVVVLVLAAAVVAVLAARMGRGIIGIQRSSTPRPLPPSPWMFPTPWPAAPCNVKPQRWLHREEATTAAVVGMVQPAVAVVVGMEVVMGGVRGVSWGHRNPWRVMTVMMTVIVTVMGRRW